MTHDARTLAVPPPQALHEHMFPAFETELVTDMRAAARAAVVEGASKALADRLSVGPYEREELTVFQRVIKADSGLKYDQVGAGRLRIGRFQIGSSTAGYLAMQ